MKKLLLICALMAFAAAAASAESTFIGVDGKTSYYGNPIHPGYAYSGAQCLYTNDELNSLYSVAADGTVTTAEISAITFYIYVNDVSYVYNNNGGDFSVTAYAQNVDDTAFAFNEANKPVMFDYSSAAQAHGEIKADAIMNQKLGDEWAAVLCGRESSLVPVTVTFDEPFKYEGKSLVLTFACESSATNIGLSVGKNAGWAPGNYFRSLIYHSHSQSMATDYTYSDKYLPNLTLDYTTVTEKPSSSAQVATIGDVSVSVRQVACEPSLGLNSEANVLEFSFEITDPANVGSYDVTLNSVNLGTVTGNFVQISFVNPNPAQDYVIGITPKAEGVVGNTATVTKELIAGLFETPAVEVTDWRLLSNYNATDETANVSASFLCTVTGIDGFAARYSNDDWCSSLGYGRVGLWGAQAYANDIPDFLAALQPATATPDNFSALKANSYQFAIAKMNWLENVAVTDAELAPISERIYFKSTITQPVAYLITPTLGAVPESINGHSYKAYNFTTTVSVSGTLTSADDHLQANVTFPEALEIKVDEVNSRIVCYAPAGSSLWYRIVEITDEAEDTPAPLLMAEGVWLEATTNPWSIGKADLSFDAIVELKTKTGDIESDVISMAIKQSGEVSSAATIEADNADTVRYFTPMGVEIAPEAIAPGTLYIRRTATGATKHLAR